MPTGDGAWLRRGKSPQSRRVARGRELIDKENSGKFPSLHVPAFRDLGSSPHAPEK